MRGHCDGMPPGRPPKPRPDQVDALLDLTRTFATHPRAQLIMPCGSGKSLVARWYAQASEARLTIVYLPSLALVGQTLAEWRRANRSWSFDALVVCSDPTTATGLAERADDADKTTYAVSAPFWPQQRAIVTTDHRAVIRFLTGPQTRPQVVFATYHSAPVVAHAQAGTRIVADLVVADEAHRLAGRPREEFRYVLDDRLILAHRRLFMTATPLTVRTEDDEPGVQDTTVRSMDDESVFGPVAHRVTFGAAIDAGRLTDYQVLVVATRSPDNNPDLLAAAPAALLDAANRYGVTRVLSYHGRVAKALAFAQAVDGLTTADGRTVRARCIHGKLPAGQRREILRWLGAPCPGEVRVVTNARCLVEGIDVPQVDGVLFADPRESVVDVVQAVGRVVRTAPGKTRGSVIVPVAVGVDDDDTELTLSRFGAVWAVLRGLRAHDDRFGDELDAAHRSYARGETGRTNILKRVQFVLPDETSPDPIRLRMVTETSPA
jgi:predicted helicase